MEISYCFPERVRPRLEKKGFTVSKDLKKKNLSGFSYIKKEKGVYYVICCKCKKSDLLELSPSSVYKCIPFTLLHSRLVVYTLIYRETKMGSLYRQASCRSVSIRVSGYHRLKEIIGEFKLKSIRVISHYSRFTMKGSYKVSISLTRF